MQILTKPKNQMSMKLNEFAASQHLMKKQINTLQEK